MAYLHVFEKLSKARIKLIKSLGLKKNRIQNNAFVLEGAKNIVQLLHSSYDIQLIIGTPDFLNKYYDTIMPRTHAVFQANPDLLASLGSFQSNHAALAVATMKDNIPIAISQPAYALVLDGIQDPGNLGTIIRIADWYGIRAIICSEDTVELYNPKVLHASMGSFMRVQLYYTDLAAYLKQTKIPIMGTFPIGEHLHQAQLTRGGYVVIGQESHGIRQPLLPYIQHKVAIPRYGQAESLNAAVATAVVCDQLRRVYPRV